MFPSFDDLQHEFLGWRDIDALIDHLLLQFRGEFDGLLMITRGGLIPGGCLVEALGIEHVLTASVYLAPTFESKLAWPTFVQFPSDALLVGRRMLVVDDIWASGRTIMFVKGRVAAAGALAESGYTIREARDGWVAFQPTGDPDLRTFWQLAANRDVVVRHLGPDLPTLEEAVVTVMERHDGP